MQHARTKHVEGVGAGDVPTHRSPPLFPSLHRSPNHLDCSGTTNWNSSPRSGQAARAALRVAASGARQEPVYKLPAAPSFIRLRGRDRRGSPSVGQCLQHCNRYTRHPAPAVCPCALAPAPGSDCCDHHSRRCCPRDSFGSAPTTPPTSFSTKMLPATAVATCGEHGCRPPVVQLEREPAAESHRFVCVCVSMKVGALSPSRSWEFHVPFVFGISVADFSFAPNRLSVLYA